MLMKGDLYIAQQCFHKLSNGILGGTGLYLHKSFHSVDMQDPAESGGLTMHHVSLQDVT